MASKVLKQNVSLEINESLKDDRIGKDHGSLMGSNPMDSCFLETNNFLEYSQVLEKASKVLRHTIPLRTNESLKSYRFLEDNGNPMGSLRKENLSL